MLSKEQKRPNTTFLQKRSDKTIKVRPKTAVIQLRSVEDTLLKSGIKKGQTDLLIDNDYTCRNNPRSRRLMKNGKQCMSACTNRPNKTVKESQRPKTAPVTHQIPLDQDLRLPILDESEYLYLHIPDDGTDSEGDHYTTNRRPRVETKSNRGILIYLMWKAQESISIICPSSTDLM
jgi:hypothetical protein